MPVHNREIADLFDELADLLEIENANPFRVRAYRNAALRIRAQSRTMADMLRDGDDLSRIPDIGEDLANKIRTIVETGKLPLLEEVRSRTPRALSDLMKIEGLGPKRVKALYTQLAIGSLDDLRRAARSGKIRELPGFGEKTEQRILDRVESRAVGEQRMRLIDAERIAAPLVEYLENSDGVRKVMVAGSYRRRKETVGDLDILVTATKGAKVMERFVDYEDVVDIVSQGDTRSTVRLRAGLSVDLRVVPQVSYGAALVYFTGSKEHNIALRKLGVGRQLKINEYGVFRNEQRTAGKTEKSVYAALDLPPIVPELRENRGELDAARKGKLPDLVSLADIRGDLHCHTSASDGQDSIKSMAKAAAARGYQYVSINDHSRHLSVANGLDEKRLLEQVEAIDRLNEELDDIVLLKSIEVDILKDGSLDLPDTVLSKLDFTVCAAHDHFKLSRRKQTERLVRAMDNPYCNILAHPTGRLINERDGYDVDLERIMEAAIARGCILELNAHPDRLDLNNSACMMAKDMGALIAISTDAHSTDGLDFMRFGVDQARRGWLEKPDVINTLPLSELRKRFVRRGD